MDSFKKKKNIVGVYYQLNEFIFLNAGSELGKGRIMKKRFENKMFSSGNLRYTQQQAPPRAIQKSK